MVQRAPWQPVSKVVCFDAAFPITRLSGTLRHVCRRFFIQQRRQWHRVHHLRRKSDKNASGWPSQKKKSGSAEHVCNWWANMSSQALKDVPVVTQVRGNEKQWANYISRVKIASLLGISVKSLTWLGFADVILGTLGNLDDEPSGHRPKVF